MNEKTELIILLIGWGVFSTIADSMTKSILSSFAYPITLTLLQMCISSIIGWFILYVVKLYPYQNAHQLIGFRSALPSSLAQTIGFALTNMSFGRVAVAFTQTIKATDPVFTLVLSIIFLGERYHLNVYLSLIPIIVGVALTSVTEITFESFGFLAAVGSNFCFSSRTILSKRWFSIVDNINFYHYLCVTAVWILIPCCLILEVPYFLSNPLVLLPLTWTYRSIFLCGLMHVLYNQISFLVLKRVAPLTHAVLNVARRVLVITASVLYFGPIPSTQNMIGTVMVFLGLLWYMRVKSQSSVFKKIL